MSGWEDALAEDVAASRAIIARRRWNGDTIALLRLANWVESLRDEVIALRKLRDGAKP